MLGITRRALGIFALGVLACRPDRLPPEPNGAAPVTPSAEPLVGPTIAPAIRRLHGCQHFSMPLAPGANVDPRQPNGEWNVTVSEDDLAWLSITPSAEGIRIVVSKVQYTVTARFGDVNGDGRVNLTDVSAVRSMNGTLVTDQTCRFDVNLDGRINMLDVAVVRSSMQ